MAKPGLFRTEGAFYGTETWRLDVVFREDDHRYQDRVGSANLSLPRKVALTISVKRHLFEMRKAFQANAYGHICYFQGASNEKLLLMSRHLAPHSCYILGGILQQGLMQQGHHNAQFWENLGY